MSALAGRFILFCWVVFFLYIFVAAFNTKRTVERAAVLGGWGLPDGVVRILVLVVIVALWLRRGGVPSIRGSGGSVIAVLASLLTLAGLLFGIWARTTLGGNWSANVVFKEGHELVLRGPYRYVRHPIYTALLLMLLGWVVLRGTPMAWLLFVIVSAGLWVKLRMEEQMMTRHFPEEYSRYKSRAKALIPFLL
jgi:protein-S-isoprenylcysteine O-methyltransferase Ste14